MISSQDGNARRVADFECDKERDGLNGIVATIYVVTYSHEELVPVRTRARKRSTKAGRGLTHEEVVCVWIRAANTEELHKVMKLAVNVAANCYRAFLETPLDRGWVLRARGISLPPAAHLIPLEALLEPRRRMVRKILCGFWRTQ
jgi:hypothetical protein